MLKTYETKIEITSGPHSSIVVPGYNEAKLFILDPRKTERGSFTIPVVFVINLEKMIDEMVEFHGLRELARMYPVMEGTKER